MRSIIKSNLYSKWVGIIFITLFFWGCAPQFNNKLDNSVINAQNDKLFLKNGLSQCPSSLNNMTVNLRTNFDDCTDPMKMQIIIINGLDTQMSASDVSYEGSWKDDVTNIIKRNLTEACGTKFSDKNDIPSIDLHFKKLTSQVISIDQKHVTDDFNLINLDSKLDYTNSINYVMQVDIGGSLFSKNFDYQKGLNIKNTGKQKETGTNYLVTISTRSEASRVVDVSILPDNTPLYLQKNVNVLDMQTVIVPVMSKEKIISYTLYSKNGDIVKKNTISTHDATLKDEPVDESDKAIINMFAGTGSGIGYVDNSIAGPYGWLLYDLSRNIIDEAK